MAENSEISWTTHTSNIWFGCVKVAGNPLCDNCYAETMDKRFGESHWGQDARRRFIKSVWNDVPKWNTKARREDNVRVFWMSMGDIFERLPEGHPDRDQMEEARQKALNLMEETSNLHHLVLTKRIPNVKKMVPAHWLENWPKHIRIGISVGTQKDADRDIPRLLELPCQNFLSMEPLLEMVSLKTWMAAPGDWRCPKCPFILHKRLLRASDGAVGADVRQEREVCPNDGATMLPLSWLDWVITGGESGPKARPSHPDWFRLLRDECVDAGVKFHFKQWGEFVSCSEVEGEVAHYHFPDGATVRRTGKKVAGRVLDGRTWDEVPEVDNAANK